jgi:glutamyl/glutaminyl-tRNA synthetase
MGDRVVSRFAPSPTGHLHIGGARTALFNWALAQRDGCFLLRIEDTDRARSSEEAVRGILEDLVWLGIHWDEGPEWTAAPGGRIVGGDPRGVGPFYQAERRALYDEHIVRLIADDRAYPAFETEEELDRLRRAAQAEKRGFRYRRPADWDRDAALARMDGEAHVIRFRMPDETLRVADEVLGEVEFAPEHFDDFVIRKRDGFPTYHLAVVVDDEAMGVTHVLRGQEHLNNTPRHVALQRALVFRAPTYAHMSLTFNPDGSKISKRDKDKAARAAVRAALQRDPGGARERLAALVTPDRLDCWLADKKRQLEPAELAALAAALGVELPGIDVEDFRRAGYLSEIFCNFLALLGWSPGLKDAQGRDVERFDRAFLAQQHAARREGERPLRSRQAAGLQPGCHRTAVGRGVLRGLDRVVRALRAGGARAFRRGVAPPLCSGDSHALPDAGRSHVAVESGRLRPGGRRGLRVRRAGRREVPAQGQSERLGRAGRGAGRTVGGGALRSRGARGGGAGVLRTPRPRHGPGRAAAARGGHRQRREPSAG